MHLFDSSQIYIIIFIIFFLQTLFWVESELYITTLNRNHENQDGNLKRLVFDFSNIY